MYPKQKSLPSIVLKAGVFSLFQKNLNGGETILDEVKEQDEITDFTRIRCPLCEWQPKATSRWFCADAGFPENFFGGCGTGWNTFATGGVCPGCAHRWRWTTCLSCAQWSRHKDWYVEKAED
ncbi:MAG: hypothetical protein M3033_00265 [Acidobacteriota bacterium]|nr:hypothetical protein [Acidobacteriota bacterium]